MVFEPAVPYEVENEVPEPDAGEPPLALHERDVTVPEMLDEQLTDWFTFTVVGEQPRELMVGVLA